MSTAGLLVLAFSVLAGCGSSVVSATKTAAARPAQLTHTAGQRCAAAARLTPGAVLPGWHMGAVQFLSATSGVGVTAESFPCFRPSKTGTQVSNQRQAVRLAVTSNGGRSWRVTGATLPIGPVAGGVNPEQLAATSATDAWALVGRGRLLATHDGGSDWELQAIPRPADEIAIERGVVWAAACPRVAGGGCRPELWRTVSASRSWTRVALPRLTLDALAMPRLAVTADNRTIALYEPTTHPNGELLTSRDGGLRWTEQRTPTWEHNRCDSAAGLIASPQRTLWLLCIGGAAAGSSTKALFRSSDGGRTWTTASAVTSLLRDPKPGSIPLEEPSALAAGSRSRLWLSLVNGMAETNNGGRYWTFPRIVNPNGWLTTIDALGSTHAWLLAAGAGLWRTTDGVHWRVVGPMNTQQL